MRSKGKIASWNDDKGYGFIAPYDSGPQIFIHIKAFSNRNRRPEVKDVVTYAVTEDNQGRTRAVNATLAGDKLSQEPKRNGATSAIFFSLVFLTVVGISVLATGLPPLVLIAYLTVSVATFIAYAIDKSAARNGRWRTPEGTLHMLSLAGGWPGALVAQQTLRHKSKKVSFRLVYWGTVILNCAAFVWLHTADGRTGLEQLLH